MCIQPKSFGHLSGYTVTVQDIFLWFEYNMDNTSTKTPFLLSDAKGDALFPNLTSVNGNWSFFDDVSGNDVMFPSEENQTEVCGNAYCVSDDEYLEMLSEYLKPTPGEWVVVGVYVLVFLVGLVGNFLVCFVVWKNRSMHTVTNYFIGMYSI